MTARTDEWAACVAAIVDGIDREWTHHGGSLRFWSKADGTFVSDLDVRLDISIRTALSKYYPSVSVLSEELGWLYASSDRRTNVVGVVDSIDGTESLRQGEAGWWSSVALVRDGNPIAGLIHQPARRVTFDSVNRAVASRPAAAFVGLSPDRVADEREGSRCRRLESAGFALAMAPHAVEKVASVLEGRCSATIAMPSEKSPIWRSWDLAACIAIAACHGIVLLDADGNPLDISDVDAPHDAAWICARDERTWQAVRTAWFDG